MTQFRINLRLERVLGAVLMVVFVGYFILGILGLIGQSERIRVQRQLTELQTAINLHLANALMKANMPAALAMAGRNPFDWTQGSTHERKQSTVKQTSGRAAMHYAGSRQGLIWSDVEPGSWVFDADKHQLLYRLNNPALVTNQDPIRDRLRWRVVVSAVVEERAPGQFLRRVTEVTLVPVLPFHWRR